MDMEDGEVPDPLVLELVPDGENVRPVLVTKCPLGIPEYRTDLNQRGHDSWPEITCWPRREHHALYTGGITYTGIIGPILSNPHSWSTQYWTQEIYMILQERREYLLKVLKELDMVKPLTRKKGSQNLVEPQPEDFGERWYQELEEKRKKERRFKL